MTCGQQDIKSGAGSIVVIKAQSRLRIKQLGKPSQAVICDDLFDVGSYIRKEDATGFISLESDNDDLIVLES